MDADGREWGNPLRWGVDRFPPASRMCGGARERVFGKDHRPGVMPALASGPGFGPQMINPRAEGPIHRFRSGMPDMKPGFQPSIRAGAEFLWRCHRLVSGRAIGARTNRAFGPRTNGVVGSGTNRAIGPVEQSTNGAA